MYDDHGDLVTGNGIGHLWIGLFCIYYANILLHCQELRSWENNNNNIFLQ